MPKSPHPYRLTIDDVAQRAGVSISTVSRVLNRSVPVSPEVAARVEAAILELNYVPRPAARNLATRQTNTLGLLLTDVTGDFFPPLFNGLLAVANEHGYDLLISTAGRHGPAADVPRSLGFHNTDGLFVFAGNLNEAGLTQAHALGFPVVLIHQSPPPGMSIPYVTVENQVATRALVAHLIERHQRRRIVLLQGPVGNDDAHWRAVGYREALAQHALPYDPALVVPGDFSREVARASVMQLLATGIAFDAIFTGDDEAAVGALEALRAGNRGVPDEVAVVGFDDQRLSAFLYPALTTVRAPTEAVGRAAAEQLIRLIRTGHAEPMTLLPTELIIRRSCGCGE